MRLSKENVTVMVEKFPKKAQVRKFFIICEPFYSYFEQINN